MESKITELKVCEKFGRLVQPIIGDELRSLEKEVSQSRDVRIFVYNDTIVGGYEKYDFAVKFGIPIKLISIPAYSFNEAVVWLCRTQLRRKDLTLMMRKYLIGRRSLAEQAIQNDKLNSVPEKTQSNNVILTPIRMRIAKEYNYCNRAVGAYEACARTVDMLYSIDRNLAIKLLNEETRILQKDLISFAKLSEKQLKHKVKNLLGSQTSFEITPAIKITPKYDPDAEISSLSLTIPSWVNLIERVRKTISPRITEKAADDIYEKLSWLETAAEKLIEQIMEVL